MDIKLILLTEILEKIEKKIGNALFYSQKKGKYLSAIYCENPYRIVKANTKSEVIELISELDFIQESDEFAIVQIPYEIGFFLNPINIPNELEIESLQINFYKKENVFEFDENEISFEGIGELININRQISNFHLPTDNDKYTENIQKIKRHLKEGNTYQINYTEIGEFDFNGNMKSLFANGIFKQSAEYCSIINNESEFVISFSPELFFSTDFSQIFVKPMKGTFPRNKNVLIDEKNKSENVMIVDLLRNDLGKIAKINSVKIQNLFELEEYETLFQLTSTISAKLIKPSISEIIFNLFPSGSITGAPKISSMKIISEIENKSRGIYTGGIGFVRKRKSIFNVSIRTAVISKETKKGKFGLGSGIVWDSISNLEYDEVLLKGKFLTERTFYFELLEAILFENGEYFLLSEHLNRMQKSSKEFLFNFNVDKILSKINELKLNFTSDKKYKVRIMMNKWGEIRTEFSEIEENPHEIRGKIKICASERNFTLFQHKTTFRPWEKIYVRNKNLGFVETIFVDKNGFLLEGAISNIILKKNGKYYTPEAKNILNGIYLNHFMKNENVEKLKIHKSELVNFDEIFICNSVRKMQKVNIIE